jgi:hypothetical protein
MCSVGLEKLAYVYVPTTVRAHTEVSSLDRLKCRDLGSCPTHRRHGTGSPDQARQRREHLTETVLGRRVRVADRLGLDVDHLRAEARPACWTRLTSTSWACSCTTVSTWSYRHTRSRADSPVVGASAVERVGRAGGGTTAHPSRAAPGRSRIPDRPGQTVRPPGADTSHRRGPERSSGGRPGQRVLRLVSVQARAFLNYRPTVGIDPAGVEVVDP